MATKIPAAQKRMFANVYICKNCTKKIRTQSTKILTGKVSCPRCDNKTFRTTRKK